MTDSLRIVNRARRIILLVSVLMSLTGCVVNKHKPFVLFDETTVIKSGTIAVINADGSETTTRLAEALTNELRERSTFKVFTQAKIGLRLGKYPVAVRDGQPENPEKPVWFGKGEKAKVDAMQAQLKVHYIFVVWTGSARTGTADSYFTSVNGNMVEYPKGRVIGYSFVSAKTSNTDEVAMLKNSAAMIADWLILAANAEKPEKGTPSGQP